jgi:uncharacterized repeat protein (TIGR02543 family)
MKSTKKLLSILLTLVMLLGLFPALNSAMAGSSAAHSYTNSAGEVFLGGKYIEVGIAKTGSFGTSGNPDSNFHPVGSRSQIGLSVDGDGFETGNGPTTGDFFLPGTEEERYILSYKIGGTAYNNNTADRRGVSWISPKAMPTTVNESSGDTLQATTTGVTAEDLEMKSTVSFTVEDKFFLTTVTLTNKSENVMEDVRWVRSFDPDQDADFNGKYATDNKVICNPTKAYDKTGLDYSTAGDQVAMVVAKGPISGDAFFFMAMDTRARATGGYAFGFSNAYETYLWESAESPALVPTNEALEAGTYSNGDKAISITFRLGDLQPGASTTFSYYSSLDPSASESVEAIANTRGGKVYHVLQNTDGTWPTGAPSTSSGSFTDEYVVPTKSFFTAKYYSKVFTPNPTQEIEDGTITMAPEDEALYVYYARDQFDVTVYKDAPGTEVLKTAKAYYQQSLDSFLSANSISDPSLAEHYFAGWAIQPPQGKGGTEYVYKEIKGGTDGDLVLTAKRVDPLTVQISSDLPVYPMFIRNRINVTLKDGTPDNSLLTALDQGTNFNTDPDELIRMGLMKSIKLDGYKLIGWPTGKGILWDEKWGTVKENADTSETQFHSEKEFYYYSLTLTALWKKVGDSAPYETYTSGSHTVHFDLNGGVATKTDLSTNTDLDVTVASPTDLNPTITLPKNIYKEGYVFQGWYMEKGDMNLLIADSDDTEIPAPGEDITLRALWSAGHYTLTLDLGGEQPEVITAIPGVVINSLPVPKDPDGTKVFGGWLYKPSGDKFELPHVMTADSLELKPKWLDREADPTGTVVARATNATTIEVTQPTGGAYEYSLDGIKWQTGTTFTVNPNAQDKYEVYVRRKASDENHAPSKNYITAEIDKTTQTAPSAPRVTTIGETSFVVDPASNALEYSIDGGKTWRYLPYWTLDIGTTDFSVRVPGEYKAGKDISPEEIAEGIVGFYNNPKQPEDMDFDVYQFPKNDREPRALDEYAIFEAAKYGVTDVRSDTINGIPVRYYYAEEISHKTEYKTLTYIFDAGDSYGELVFWLDETGKDSSDEITAAQGIIGSLMRGRVGNDSFEFTGLTPGAEYTVLTRFAETSTQMPSEASPAAYVKTQKKLTDVTLRKVGEPDDMETLEVLDTLYADTNGAHPVNCQWYRVSPQGKEYPIEGATETSYTLGYDDMGYKIFAVVSQTLDTEVKLKAAAEAVVTEIERSEPPALSEFSVTKNPTTPPDREGVIVYSGDTELEYSNDGGKSWRPFTSPLENLPAGDYYFRTKGQGKVKAPSEPVGPLKLSAVNDLDEIKISTSAQFMDNGTELTAVSNLDSNETYNASLSYRWYRIKKNADAEQGGETKISLGTDKKYTVTSEDKGCTIMLEVTWTLNGYTKTLSTSTPVVGNKPEETGGRILGGQILDADGNPISDAIVELRQGNTVIASITSDANGSYSFTGVADGIYNVVSTYDGKTMTNIVVFPKDESKNITMPAGKVSSKLIVVGDTPAIVVGNLDEEAATISGGSGTDTVLKLEVESKGDLTETDDVELTIAQREEKTAQQAVKDAVPDYLQADNELKFFDMSVVKTTTTSGTQITTETSKVSQTANLLQILIPFEGIQDFYNVTIYRYHDDNVDVITTSPNADGEYIEIGTDCITLYAKNFSVYAIGYTEENIRTTRRYFASSDENAKEEPEKEEETGVCPKDETCPISAFSDASPTAWYHDGVHWALENGVMQGFGGGLFKPNGATSRAQMAQILWNLEGQPEATAAFDFSDVVDGAWYVPSLRWANSVGVIVGYANGKIGPNDTMTREQLVTVIYRYAALKGNAKAPEESTLEYSDSNEVSSWAAEAFHWAVQADIVKGDEAKRLAPKGTATRAEIATIMMRYCEITGR